MKKNLMSGMRYIYHNENWCVQQESDQYYGAEVWFASAKDCSRNMWARGFKIRFNGMLIHSSVTFPSMERKLNGLIVKYHLELIEVEPNNE
jgi:hypothetical protein